MTVLVARLLAPLQVLVLVGWTETTCDPSLSEEGNGYEVPD
jgi:hypothetical protein